MQTNNRKTAAVILAAGHGKRMGTQTAKQYLLLGGKPVLFYALKAFEDSCVDSIILVTGEDEIQYCKNEIVTNYGFEKVKAIVAGGKERYHSVANGLHAAKELMKDDKEDFEVVLIHDGARPFVTPDMIENLITETRKYHACVTGTPVKDTIKIANEQGFCEQTPSRNLVWAVQTPQTFLFELVYNSYEKLLQEEQSLIRTGIQITDDAMVVEQMTNEKVRLVMGSYSNIKLTTPEDMIVCEALLKNISSYVIN